MKERILDCSTKLLGLLMGLGLAIGLTAPLSAQSTYGNRPMGNRTVTKQKKKKEKKPSEIEYPLFNGVNVGVDLWGLGGKLFGSDFMSSEVSVDVDLKHRFFPVMELGYGSTDSWNEKGTHYKSSAPYVRIGMDYNSLFRKAHGHQLRLGLRYATSSFKYDIDAMGVDDPIYGGGMGNPNLGDEVWGGSVPFHHKGMKGSMQWLEFCVGIRAQIWKQVSMGWAMRFKFKTSASTDTYGNPWYVPGFGQYGSNSLGITYTIVYKLPIK